MSAPRGYPKLDLSRKDFRRKLVNQLVTGLLWGIAALSIYPLLNVFAYVLRQGGPSLSWAFFAELPAPVGEAGGGMLNALVGSALLIALASLVGVPFGIGIGLYLSEFPGGKLHRLLRFSIDLFASVPSIIIGLFAYAVVVVPMKRFSTLAGAFALFVIMVPLVARTTEEMLKLVPQHIREAGLALGVPRWKVLIRIVLRGSVGGILTGVMLAIARISGETAPLLFTAFNNRFWSVSLAQPIASLPVQIYTYAVSPYEEWHAQAWSGALVLMSLVLALNLLTRFAFQRKGRG